MQIPQHHTIFLAAMIFVTAGILSGAKPSFAYQKQMAPPAGSKGEKPGLEIATNDKFKKFEGFWIGNWTTKARPGAKWPTSLDIESVGGDGVATGIYSFDGWMNSFMDPIVDDVLRVGKRLTFTWKKDGTISGTFKNQRGQISRTTLKRADKKEPTEPKVSDSAMLENFGGVWSGHWKTGSQPGKKWDTSLEIRSVIADGVATGTYTFGKGIISDSAHSTRHRLRGGRGVRTIATGAVSIRARSSTVFPSRWLTSISSFISALDGW